MRDEDASDSDSDENDDEDEEDSFIDSEEKVDFKKLKRKPSKRTKKKKINEKEELMIATKEYFINFQNNVNLKLVEVKKIILV